MCTLSTDKLIQYLEDSNQIHKNLHTKIINLENTVNELQLDNIVDDINRNIIDYRISRSIDINKKSALIYKIVEKIIIVLNE